MMAPKARRPRHAGRGFFRAAQTGRFEPKTQPLDYHKRQFLNNFAKKLPFRVIRRIQLEHPEFHGQAEGLRGVPEKAITTE